MKRVSMTAVLLLCGLGLLQAEAPVILRYSHMNTPDSIAGLQARYFAQKVKEYSNGSITVEVYPESQLGSLKEQVAQVSAGVVAINHNTAAGIGSLYEDFAVLDTPYIYRDVTHLMHVVSSASPLMKRLSDGLIRRNGVRVLYTFYFGARCLTADRPVRRPEDLKDVKIRCIPFPIYSTAVEGLGAIPTPIDWGETQTALKTRLVAGQENPVNTILSGRLWEYQSHLMLTDHILGAEIVIMNQQIWNSLSRVQQTQLQKAATEAGAYATSLTQAQEQKDIAALKSKGMTVIGPAEGLDVKAFKDRTRKLVEERFGLRWAEYYRIIESIP